MCSLPSLRFRRLWTPARITSSLWLDAADSSTITLVSGTVSQWNDKSGNNRHATSPPGSRPTYSENKLVFNGSKYFICSPGWGNYWSWFLVFKHDATDVLQVAMRDSMDGDSTAIVGYPSNRTDFYRLRNTSNTIYSSSLANEFGTQIRQHSFNSKTTNQAESWVDGTLKTTWNVSGDMGSTLYIGINGIFSPDGIRGNIYELIILPTESDTTVRQKIEGYLAHKWKLASNLPSTHPFKNYPPRGL